MNDVYHLQECGMIYIMTRCFDSKFETKADCDVLLLPTQIVVILYFYFFKLLKRWRKIYTSMSYNIDNSNIEYAFFNKNWSFWFQLIVFLNIDEISTIKTS